MAWDQDGPQEQERELRRLPMNSQLPRWVQVEAQGHLVRVSLRGAPPPGGLLRSKRGTVRSFSRSSRKRMLETLARMDPELSPFGASMITLTYGELFPDATGAKRDLFTFWKRVRRAWPDSSGIWRLEFQRRGAPHFHLIYFGPFFDKYQVQAWWGEVIGQERPFTRIEGLRNWRHSMAYAAKYLAKVPKPVERCADAAGPAPGGGGDGAAADARGLDYVSYLTGEEQVGRTWGLLERRKLPWGERWEFPLEMGKWVYSWKRAARKRWRGVNKRGHAGASLFVDNPAPWVYLAALQRYGERGGGTAGLRGEGSDGPRSRGQEPE